MANTYTWKITNLKTQRYFLGVEDYIVSANFEHTVTDPTGKYQFINKGQANFPTPSLPEDITDALPYADITEAKIIEWIENNVYGSSSLAIERASMDRRIDEQKYRDENRSLNSIVISASSTEDKPLPW